MDDKPVVIQEPKPSKPVEHHPRHFHVFWPLLLITVGVFLFLNTTHMIPGDTLDTLFKLWPLLLVVGGIDGFINRGGFVWSVLLAGLGVLLLLSNFGYIQVSVWTLALRLWPLLIIAVGLDLIIGRRHGWLSWILGVFVGLVMVAGIYWFAMTYAGGSPERIEEISIPLVGAKSAEGNISMAAGSLHVTGGASDKNVLEGDIELRRNEGYSQNSTVKNEENDFSLETEESHSYYPFDTSNYTWDLRLNESVPMDLTLELAAGEMVADLGELNLTHFDIKIAAGSMQVTLPEEGKYSGSIQGAASSITIFITQPANVCITSSTAVSIMNLPEGYNQESVCKLDDVSTVKIENAVGVISVKYMH